MNEWMGILCHCSTYTSGEEILRFFLSLNARAGFEPAISNFPKRQLYPLHQGQYDWQEGGGGN